MNKAVALDRPVFHILETSPFFPHSPIHTSPNWPAPRRSTNFSVSLGTSHSSSHHGFWGFWVWQGRLNFVHSPSEASARTKGCVRQPLLETLGAPSSPYLSPHSPQGKQIGMGGESTGSRVRYYRWMEGP